MQRPRTTPPEFPQLYNCNEASEVRTSGASFFRCIQNNRNPPVLYNFYQLLICPSINSLWNASGHSHYISFFYKFTEFLFKFCKILFCKCESRLQKFRLYLISLIPDIDTGSAFCIHMVECTSDSKWLQCILNVRTRMTTHKPGRYHIRSINGCRFGNIKSFSSWHIGTFLNTIYLTYFKLINHVPLINSSI